MNGRLLCRILVGVLVLVSYAQGHLADELTSELRNSFQWCKPLSRFDPGLVLFWNPPENNNLTIGLATKHDNWLGFGISTEIHGEMIPSDSLIVYQPDNGATVWRDNFQNFRAYCQVDAGVCEDTVLGGINDWTLHFSGKTDGVYYYVLSRPADTGDVDNDVAVVDEIQQIIFSFGLDYEDFDLGHQGQTILDFNLFEAPDCENNCTAHGSCVGGCCVCEEGYEGFFCEIEITTNPDSSTEQGPSDDLTPAIDPSTYAYSINMSDSYVLYWNTFLDLAEPEIEFAVRAHGTGWVGFGPAKGQSMVNSDPIIGWVIDGVPVVKDFYNSEQSECVGGSGVCEDPQSGSGINGQNNVLAYNGREIDGYTELKWRRKLNTGDNSGLDIPIVNGTMYAVWAFQRTEEGPPANKHEPGDNAFLEINFIEGIQVVPTEPPVNEDIPSEVKEDDFQFSTALGPSKDLKVYWKIEDDTILVGLQCKCTGWVAFGPSKNGIMLDSDVILGWVDSEGTPTMRDYYIKDRAGGCPGVCQDTNSEVGGVDNVLGFNGNFKDGVTELIYKRKLNTGDSKGDIAITNNEIKVAWGFNPDNKGPSLQQHDANTKGIATINFFTGSVSEQSTTIKEVHGYLMFFAWGVFAPSASFVARYLKGFPWWFNIHRILMGTAIASTVSAFIMAMSFTTEHFTSVHHIFGLIVVILGSCQPIIGTLADMWFDINRNGTPIFPDIAHWILGWGAFGLGVVNIALGMDKYGVSNALLAVYSVYAVIVVSFLVGFFVFRLINPKKGGH